MNTRAYALRCFDAAASWIPTRVKGRLLRRWLAEALYPGIDGLRELQDTSWSLMNLRRAGFAPTKIIDCGAYVGKWTKNAKAIFPHAHVLMLEANDENRPALTAVAAEYPGEVGYTIALLGPEPRAAVPYYRMATGSSVLPEQSNVNRGMTPLPMVTLDEIAGAMEFPAVDLIKLDVQGYELEVLKGARRILQTASVVLLEVSFLQYNQGAPLVHQVLSAMDEHGFVAFDIGAMTRWGSQNTLLQADVIFVRPDSPWRPASFTF